MIFFLARCPAPSITPHSPRRQRRIAPPCWNFKYPTAQVCGYSQPSNSQNLKFCVYIYPQITCVIVTKFDTLIDRSSTVNKPQPQRWKCHDFMDHVQYRLLILSEIHSQLTIYCTVMIARFAGLGSRQRVWPLTYSMGGITYLRVGSAGLFAFSG